MNHPNRTGKGKPDESEHNKRQSKLRVTLSEMQLIYLVEVVDWNYYGKKMPPKTREIAKSLQLKLDKAITELSAV